MTIVNSKQIMTIEKITEIHENYSPDMPHDYSVALMAMISELVTDPLAQKANAKTYPHVILTKRKTILTE